MAEVPPEVRHERVELARTGSLPFSDLNPAERDVVNAELDAAIRARVETTEVSALLREEGQTTLSLDDDGRIVEHHPDGSARSIGNI